MGEAAEGLGERQQQADHGDIRRRAVDRAGKSRSPIATKVVKPRDSAASISHQPIADPPEARIMYDLG